MLSTPDIRWLLTCLKPPAEENEPLLLSGCAEIDWAELIAYTDRHGLTPLLYFRLKDDADLWSVLSSEVQERLAQRHASVAQRNLLHYYHLLKLAKTLEEKGISVMMLKGIYLAEFVYPDRGLRPMGDIDILIHESDLARVEKVLVKQGYARRNWPEPEWLAERHFHLAYTHPDTLVTIEVHWHVQRPTTANRMEIEEVWRQARPVTLAGVSMLTMAREHLLLHQCLHMVTHSYQLGLRAFYDVALILAKEGNAIDWARLMDCTERWGAGKALCLGLNLAGEFFGRITAQTIESVQPSLMAQERIDTAREQVLAWRSSARPPSSEFSDMWEQERDGDWLRRLWQRVFIPPTMMAALYPVSAGSWRVYLYYPVRIMDLLKVYPPLIWQMIRRDDDAVAQVKHADRVKSLEQWLAESESTPN